MEKKLIIQEVPKSFIAPEFDPEDYIFGSGQIYGEVVQPNGQWLTPEEEVQVKKVETYNCTAFAITSAFEALFQKKFGQVKNFSDRALGIFAGTRPPGNSPKKVAQTAHEKGLVPELLLPFTDFIDTVEKYYSYFMGDEAAVIREAEKFYKEYEINYDWVSNGYENATPERIMEALMYSFVDVAVYGWALDGDRYVRPQGVADTHWTCIVGYKQNEYWLVFDSYAPFLKKLDWNYGFRYAQRYHISKRLTQEQVSLFSKILNFLTSIFKSPNIPDAKKEAIIPITIETIKSISDAIPKPAPRRMINVVAKAIQEYEDYVPPGGTYRNGTIARAGSVSWRNKNPGNIKGLDGKFLKFQTYDKGFSYLEDYIERACTGVHNAYKKGGRTTILEYFMIYAPTNDNNFPLKYARFVAEKCGLTINDPISKWLEVEKVA